MVKSRQGRHLGGRVQRFQHESQGSRPASRARPLSVLSTLVTGSGSVALQIIPSTRGVQQSVPFRFGSPPSHRGGPCRHGDLARGRASTSAPFFSMTASRPLLPRRSH